MLFPSSLSAPIMEAKSTCEISVNFYETTWCSIPEDCHLRIRRCYNLKPHSECESTYTVRIIIYTAVFRVVTACDTCRRLPAIRSDASISSSGQRRGHKGDFDSHQRDDVASQLRRQKLTSLAQREIQISIDVQNCLLGYTAV
jgi:hypothetical protein